MGKGFFSGAFRASALTADRLTLDAVPDAWDGAPKLAGVDVAFIRDPLARFNALKTGEIDLMLYTPADAVPLVKGAPGLSYKATSSGSRIYVVLNHKRARPRRGRRAPGRGPDDRPQADRRESAQRGLRRPDNLYPSRLSPGACPGC